MTEKFGEEYLSVALNIEKTCFSEPWTEGAFTLLGIPAGYGNVAFDGGVPSGYSAMLTAADEAQLLRIAVLPEARGKGLAREMLSDLYAVAKERGCAVMTLEVRESNVPARRLYASEGFEITGRREKYYSDPREAAILMEKKL